MQPILSIITVNLNNHEGLKNTLKSIMQQKSNYYEHIIIDGGSTDGSIDTILEYGKINPQLVFWTSEKDKGIYNAMNKGIMHANGKYLLFLNSGDYLEPNILAQIEHKITGEDIIYGDIYIISESNHKNLTTFPDPPLNASLVVSKDFYLPHPATFIKKTLFNNEIYNEQYKIISDWEFWIKCIIFKNCTTKHISIPISNFIEGGISSTNNEMTQSEKADSLQKLFPPKILESLDKLFLIEQSPFCETILKYKTSKRFTKRINRLVIFCYKIHNLFIRKK